MEVSQQNTFLYLKKSTKSSHVHLKKRMYCKSYFQLFISTDERADVRLKLQKQIEKDKESRNLVSKIICTNNEKNDQFYRKVAFLMYPERVNFRPQRWKEASKIKPHRGLGTRLPST